MGPWTHSVRNSWTRVVKRMSVPPGAKEAIMSVGLMGGTGILDIDGLTVELIPVDGVASTNLVLNGDFELGDPAPFGWQPEKDAKRVFPGFNSQAAIELRAAKSRLLTGLAIPVEPFQALDISMAVQCSGLRGAGGAAAGIFFLDDFGRPLAGHENGDYFFQWDGTFTWRVDDAQVRVPPGARRAVLQIEKPYAMGAIRIDDVRVSASPNPGAGSWTPFHVADETDEWLAVPPSRQIKAKSALDVSFLLPAPARAIGDRSPSRTGISRSSAAGAPGSSVLPWWHPRRSCEPRPPINSLTAWPARV